MVSFDTDPLDGPRLSTSDPGGSLMRAVMYVLGVGMLFVLLGVAQNTVAPAVGGLMEGLIGVNTGQNTGPIQFGDP